VVGVALLAPGIHLSIQAPTPSCPRRRPTACRWDP
jgi:hypothetical protein